MSKELSEAFYSNCREFVSKISSLKQVYCLRSCLYFLPDQICSRPRAFNLQPQQKTEMYSALEVQSERVPIWTQCSSDFFSFFLLSFGFFKRRLFLSLSSKHVKYLWAEWLFSRYLVQLLLWVAVTVADFLHWWQLNNTSAICPWMELALNFNLPFKKTRPLLLICV